MQVAREQVASLIQASPEEIVFTSGATESNNLAIKGTGQGHFISATTEHKSVLDPLESLKRNGATVSLLPVNPQGMLSLPDLEKEIRTETRLVTLMYANNEIGVTHNIKKIGEICKQRNVAFHCDATQAVGKCRIDVRDLAVTMLSLSGHKVYGPKGVGALFVRKGTRITPQLDGGGHENGYRSGTLNVPGIVGLGKACELAEKHLARDAEQMHSLAARLLEILQTAVGGLHVIGSTKYRIPGNLNIRFDGVDNARLLGKISSKVAVSVSSACQSTSATPSHVLSALGLEEQHQREALRIGIGRFTTEEEIRLAASFMAKAIQEIRH